MADFRVAHVFDCSEETYWGQLFFDAEYNRRLFLEKLRFPTWRVIHQEEKGDEVRRTIEAVPPVGDLPAALKSVIGEGAGYEERGTFERATRRYRIEVVPNRLSDKITVKLSMSTEPSGEGRCRRIVEGTVTAKIFGVGGLLERKMIADLEKSYAKSAEFTNDFVREKGLS